MAFVAFRPASIGHTTLPDSYLRLMTDYFISRHKGAIEWAKPLLPAARFLSEVPSEDLHSGDCVYGTIPIDIAATLCASQVRVFALVFDRNGLVRGNELSADELRLRNAHFEEYVVHRILPEEG